MHGQARAAGPPLDSGRSRAPRGSGRTGTLEAGPFSSAGLRAVTGLQVLPDGSLPEEELPLPLHCPGAVAGEQDLGLPGGQGFG